MGKSALPRRKRDILAASSSDTVDGGWRVPRRVSPGDPIPSYPVGSDRRRGIPVTTLLLIGWLVWRGWTVENIAGLLRICSPEQASVPRTANS